MKNYDHSKIEKKWQKEWDAQKLYKTESPSKKKKHYVLDMFPYPSGAGLHVGHPRGYIGSDVYARKKRMEGYNVLHPMGYDAFGLPAEQYAIEHKVHPRVAVEKNIKTFRGQLDKIGFSYDWSRQVNTTDPEYYKWTQWIFLQIYNSYYNEAKNKACPISELINKFEKQGGENFSKMEWKNFSKMQKENILMNYRLAYEGQAQVNWCPKMGTVLANDEIVEDQNGNLVSERGGYPVEKKSMRQWFMRITAYADRLIADLEDLNWSTHIKEIQKNWIGKSEGLIFSAPVKDSDIIIQTFSAHYEACYADTFVAIAPDHPLLAKLLDGRVEKEKVFKKANEIVEKRNKEGEAYKDVDGIFTGRYIIDPLGNGDLPIWVASFALKDYGTGIVKCSAHDERDFAFAQKFNIPTKEVLEPLFIKKSGSDGVKTDLPFVERNAVVCVVKHWSEDKYLCLKWKKNDWQGFVVGGIDDWEDAIHTGMREVHEETGYKNTKFIKKLGGKIHSQFYHEVKKENRFAHFDVLYYELQDDVKDEIAEKEKALHDVLWVSKTEVAKFASKDEDMEFIWKCFSEPAFAWTDMKNSILKESKQFTGRIAGDVRQEIADHLEKNKFAVRKTSYKLRDAIFARQRYWGEPIPLRHDNEGVNTPLKEKELPLKLPNVNSYEFTGTGESPLAAVKSWLQNGYETNTMPGWAGSSWYFLRYMDPKNKRAFADKKSLKYWKEVDMYVGGQEHATGHLLYSRFWHKFLFDMGYVPMKEPFKTLKNQGMILASDGRKMSKRWGNVINPDEIVKNYGADTLRVYEMFMGPFEASQPWSTESIIGSRRFIEKVWRLGQKINENNVPLTEKFIQSVLHKTIKKVSDDIQDFAFNTCVSSMMICLNEMEKENVSKKDFKMFLQILAPFAPHVADELWHELGEKKSIHQSAWPKYDPKKIVEDKVKIGISVNGKVRGELFVTEDMTEEDIKAKALKDKVVMNWTKDQEIKRVVYVKGRLVNIVV